MESWKPVVDFEDLYEISTLGRVKSLARLVHYSDGRIRKYKERILNPRIDGKGYYFMSLYKDKIPYQLRVHQLVCKAFINNYENKPCVNHINGDRLNNNIINLEWCTYKENTRNGIDRGTIKRPAAKLKEKDVTRIRKLYKNNKISQYKLAIMFNINQPQISRIVNNKNWK